MSKLEGKGGKMGVGIGVGVGGGGAAKLVYYKPERTDNFCSFQPK